MLIEGDDRFVYVAPSIQNAIDMLPSWYSQLPIKGVISGSGNYFFTEDNRPAWAVEQWGGIKGLNVLELGPLEGGHTYQLEKMGGIVTAIEGNKISFLKCLVVKNALNMQATFLLGNINKYLEQQVSGRCTWPAIFASGVLYHSTDPIGLLEKCSKITDNLFLWTHYVDSGETPAYFQGELFLYRLHKYPEAERNSNTHCGGLDTWTCHMRREDIFKILSKLGFNKITYTDEQRDHPGGPCISISARRL